jgi:predicted enzyme involved in methoxymalonyl-ACP biosynthesis
MKKETEKMAFIDTWFMSCRVLKRGMEHFVLNTIANFAVEKGFEIIQGEYLPTAKNEMVRDHYQNLGFEKRENAWILDLKHYKTKKVFINLK